MSATDLEIVKKIYAALNQGDVPGVLKFFDPQVLRVEFEDLPTGGTYRGLSEVSAHFLQARSTWAEGACTPERLISEGNKVVVLVHVRVRLKDKTEWIEGRVADGFAFENGKVIEMRSYLKAEDAFAWAGIKGP